MRVAVMAGELIYANVRLRLPANLTYWLVMFGINLQAAQAMELFFLPTMSLYLLYSLPIYL